MTGWKRPKLYCTDSGLCAFLTGVKDPRDLHDLPLGGPLWETFVFSELRRAQLAASGGWSLWFFRDRRGEVDFLRHRGGLFDLADAKLSRSPRAADARSLRRVAAELGPDRVQSMTLLSATEASYPLDEGLWAQGPGDPWPPTRAV